MCSNNSAVFRDMWSSSRGELFFQKRIELVDPDFETAEHLERFLLVVCQRNKGYADFMANEEAIYAFCQLLRKYDCQSLISTFLLSLRVDLDSLQQHSAWFIFLAAAYLYDPELCRDSIPIAGRWAWTCGKVDKDKLPLSHAVIPGASCLDVTAMPDIYRQRMPEEYFAALLRANHVRGSIQGSKGNWEAVGAEFYRQLTEPGEFKLCEV